MALKKKSGDMRNLYWLSDTQVSELKPFFPKSHGKPYIDNRRVLSGVSVTKPKWLTAT